MHQPTTQARPSLYYRYQIFQPWLPSAHPAQDRKKVVIVGSGPAGMVAALELARLGVPSVILSSEQQVSQGSRAIVFTRRSMEILQQVGVAERMTENGLPWRFGNSYYRGQRVFRMEAPHDPDDRFFPMLNIQQQFMEQYLLETCQASPLIDFRWGNKVTQVAQDSELARVSVDTPEGPYTLETDWLIAADGGRSEIRAAMNLKMEGSSYEGFFVIADIRIDLPLPTERLAYFDPDWNPGNTILMHREPHGIWRVDYQLPPGETPEEALRPESLKQRIDAQLAMIGHAGVPWEMDWNSVYSARNLTLPDYVQGRVLFTGDAAHLLPIFGVRGANTAFQDAQSLAWHLAFVVKGLASKKLLANHSRERVGAAREIIAEAGKSTRFMAPPSPGFRLLRDAVLSLSLTEAFVRPLYHWRTSRPHEYADSALNSLGDDNALFQSGPAHGAPPQNICLGSNDFLLDHLGGGFDLLYFTQAATIPESLQQVVTAIRARGVPLKIIAIGNTERVAGADLTLADADGHFRQRYGVSTSGAAYLLRPDQHVCARWLTLDANRLQAALNIALPQS
ncbi:FAD-dependent monooxygenase [Herbaspirillum sp. RTI4]|uniref:FAD-dependent monooxygenase n=1 Tax=Herbaspirillum sp. RTI4 TaxID=3048640 RepID=UPI002AB3431C|nr:FAD-dependent monooxygenase [Herbaspirillum sp. RTI4]MDY7578975.1 FAD-dependent monooxygenase [Herbaspirillum sp. RTI4]MEA9980906.1 FAD-dependent monooxygenase [Herbaspirillum sp. RTI4]